MPLKLESELRAPCPCDKAPDCSQAQFSNIHRVQKEVTQLVRSKCGQSSTLTQHTSWGFFTALPTKRTFYQPRYVEILFSGCYFRTSQDYLSYSDRNLVRWEILRDVLESDSSLLTHSCAGSLLASWQLWEVEVIGKVGAKNACVDSSVVSSPRIYDFVFLPQ